MKNNVILIVIDCLRRDYVTHEHMPWLSRFGHNHLYFSNYWGSSHCTDPSITHMLSGKHPDELRLYSMMFERKDYSIPKDTRLLTHIANENGYTTATITNLQRWYHWGSDLPTDSRHMPLWNDYEVAKDLIKGMPEPWFIFFHVDTMHRNYAGGNYKAAAKLTDQHMELVAREAVFKDAAIFVTSDHGEGLGQAGPDGHPVRQHGYGLWPFLTHLPLVAKFPEGPHQWKRGEVPELMGHDQLHELILQQFRGEDVPSIRVPYAIFQAGATPRVFHRGIVTRDGSQVVVATYKGGEYNRFYSGEFSDLSRNDALTQLIDHMTLNGIDTAGLEDQLVLDRLEGLGYFEK